MDFTQFVWSIGISLVQFIIGLVLAVFSVYLGIRVLDSLTKGLDEWKEIKKGNVAVGILVACVVLSVAVVVESGVSSLSTTLTAQATNFSIFSLSLLAAFINLLIGIAAAMVGIYFAITIFDQLTENVDEYKQLKNGNIAVAILLGSVLFAVSFVIKGAVDALIMTLNISGLFGL